MGHGAARELTDEVEAPALASEASARLDAALEKLDRSDAKFKAARDEERFSQQTKTWHRVCAELDGHLRNVASGLVKSHQLNLDVGTEGGGLRARPWIEEMGQIIGRLSFQFEDNNVVAKFNEQALTTVAVKKVAHDWVERAVVDWVVAATDSRSALTKSR